MESIFQSIMLYFIEQLPDTAEGMPLKSFDFYDRILRSGFVTLEKKRFIWNLGVIFANVKTDWYFTFHIRVLKEMFDNHGAVCIIVSLNFYK